jgi:hypothetical protein
MARGLSSIRGPALDAGRLTDNAHCGCTRCRRMRRRALAALIEGGAVESEVAPSSSMLDWPRAGRSSTDLRGETRPRVARRVRGAPAAWRNWTLHDFPAHRTDLNETHRDAIAKVTDKILATFLLPSIPRNKRVRCVRLTGHAATWRGMTKDEYSRLARTRAVTAAEELSAQLETTGLVTKLFYPADDLDLPGERGCRPVSGVNVALFVDDKADDEPLRPNMIERTDSEARANRAYNRRVHIALQRSVVLPRPTRKQSQPVPKCNEPGSVCVYWKGGPGVLDGKRCWAPGQWWFSPSDLDEAVMRGNATYHCDSR